MNDPKRIISLTLSDELVEKLDKHLKREMRKWIQSKRKTKPSRSIIVEELLRKVLK